MADAAHVQCISRDSANQILEHSRAMGRFYLWGLFVLGIIFFASAPSNTNAETGTDMPRRHRLLSAVISGSASACSALSRPRPRAVLDREDPGDLPYYSSACPHPTPVLMRAPRSRVLDAPPEVRTQDSAAAPQHMWIILSSCCVAVRRGAAVG
jgi:hypothetical protein